MHGHGGMHASQACVNTSTVRHARVVHGLLSSTVRPIYEELVPGLLIYNRLTPPDQRAAGRTLDNRHHHPDR